MSPRVPVPAAVLRRHDAEGCCRHSDYSIEEGVCCTCDAEDPCDFAVIEADEYAVWERDVAAWLIAEARWWYSRVLGVCADEGFDPTIQSDLGRADTSNVFILAEWVPAWVRDA